MEHGTQASGIPTQFGSKGAVMHKDSLKKFMIGALLGISGFGVAAVTIPNVFTAGTQIRAADVNANFNALKVALETAAGIDNGAISAAKLNIGGTIADGKVLKAQGGNLTWGDDSGFSLPFSGSINAASAGNIGLSITSNDASKTAIKGLGGNYGVVGDTASAAGAGVLAANSSSGMALEVSGGIKVSGSNKPAFVHQAIAANSASNYTCLDHPLTNNRPNALLFVTQNFNPNGGALTSGIYNDESIGVFYGSSSDNPLSFTKWCIFNQNTSTVIPLNAKFNVLVINQ
jgi:hypothetical protein